LTKRRIIDIPEEYLPKIDELPGELPKIARVIEERCPGLGVPITLALAQTYPGQNLYIHSAKKIEDAVRNDMIRAKYDQGAKVKDLATETGLCTRQIERILAEAGTVEDNRQMRMF
jgi:Mor family transcriptional regulator